MDENNTNNELKSEVRKHVCFENHCWKKCLAMVLASFLGGFLAFYFVATQVVYKHQRPYYYNQYDFEKDLYRDIEKKHKEELNALKKAFKINQNIETQMLAKLGKTMQLMNPVKIKSEFDDNKFNIIVSLKPFQGDENKINYNIQGRKLTVFGSSQTKDNEYQKDVSFSQDFILPENADTFKISKIKDGDSLIISVPMKE